jgi:hypothetical protein
MGINEINTRKINIYNVERKQDARQRHTTKNNVAQSVADWVFPNPGMKYSVAGFYRGERHDKEI